jgi:gliding motility-associated-like protein
LVKVIDPDTLDCNLIFIPNAFTPSSSLGRNDVFGVSNPYSVDEFISFEVFDRWGGRIFNAPTVFDTWDGTVQGQPANAGTFFVPASIPMRGNRTDQGGQRYAAPINKEAR